MPNWCDNTLNISNSDKSKIDELEAELRKSEQTELFQHLRPYDGDWDYGWCCENWGCKWDARIIDWERLEDNLIVVYFETAWAPPIALYDYLTEEGWNIEAFYYEPGMCFAGMYSEGNDDCYEYSDLSADEIEEQFPHELNDMYCISERQREWEEENEDDDLSEDEMIQALDELKKEYEDESFADEDAKVTGKWPFPEGKKDE